MPLRRLRFLGMLLSAHRGVHSPHDFQRKGEGKLQDPSGLQAPPKKHREPEFACTNVYRYKYFRCICYVYIYIYHMYIHIYIYICLCVYLCEFLCIYIYKCIYVFIELYLYTYIFICVYVHLCVCVEPVSVYV